MPTMPTLKITMIQQPEYKELNTYPIKIKNYQEASLISQDYLLIEIKLKLLPYLTSKPRTMSFLLQVEGSTLFLGET
jgi:hypothetical protein